MEVFLSYSRRDTEFVSRIGRDLSARGFEVWLDTQDIVGGGIDRWRTSIVAGIRRSDVVVVVLSPNSVQSENVERELTVAAENRRRVVPILHQPCELPDGFQYELAGLQHIDFVVQSYDRAFDELLRQLQATVAPDPARPPVLPSPGPTPLTTVDVAPFSVVATIDHGDSWTVWLEKPLPPSTQWPTGTADEAELLGFVGALGAVDAMTWIRLVLEGSPGHTSTISGARARLLDRRTPAPMSSFTNPAEGVDETIGWYLDLDGKSPDVYELVNGTDRGQRFFAGKVITVAPGEAVTIEVKAFATACDCRWVLDLDVVVDGASRVVTVDNSGEPFRTSSGQPSVPKYVWAYYLDPPGIYRDDNGNYVPMG